MARIGITGARGVLGSRIAAELTRHGHDIAAFAGDVRDAKAVDEWVDGVETVIHCAAIVPVNQVADHVGAAIAINVAGTANVAAAVGRHDRRLVYISTSHVYQPKDTGLGEADAVAPMSLYGLTKRQGEEWTERLVRAPLILRLFSYFDERQAESFLVPGLRLRIAKVAAGAKVDLFGGYNRRDMASATWLAEACVALLDAGAAGVVNCATGSDLTVMAIAKRMAGIMNREDISWNVIQDRPVDTLVSDNRRLRALIPMLPPFDLDAALTAYVRDAAPETGNGLERRLRGHGVD